MEHQVIGVETKTIFFAHKDAGHTAKWLRTEKAKAKSIFLNEKVRIVKVQSPQELPEYIAFHSKEAKDYKEVYCHYDVREYRTGRIHPSFLGKLLIKAKDIVTANVVHQYNQHDINATLGLLTVQTTNDPDKMQWVYEHSPISCCGRKADEYQTDGVHPMRVLATENTGCAWAPTPDGKGVLARALVHFGAKVYRSVYASTMLPSTFDRMMVSAGFKRMGDDNPWYGKEFVPIPIKSYHTKDNPSYVYPPADIGYYFWERDGKFFMGDPQGKDRAAGVIIHHQLSPNAGGAGGYGVSGRSRKLLTI